MELYEFTPYTRYNYTLIITKMLYIGTDNVKKAHHAARKMNIGFNTIESHELYNYNEHLAEWYSHGTYKADVR